MNLFLTLHIFSFVDGRIFSSLSLLLVHLFLLIQLEFIKLKIGWFFFFFCLEIYQNFAIFPQERKQFTLRVNLLATFHRYIFPHFITSSRIFQIFHFARHYLKSFYSMADEMDFCQPQTFPPSAAFKFPQNLFAIFISISFFGGGGQLPFSYILQLQFPFEHLTHLLCTVVCR